MTEKRYVAIGVEWTDGFIQDHQDDNDLFGIGAVVDCLNEQDNTIKHLQLNNKLLLEEMEEIRDKINVFLEILSKNL